MKRHPKGVNPDRQTAAEDAAAKKRRTAARYFWGARALFGLSLLIVLQHLLAHSGWQPVPLTMGWQDLLIGYPMAAVLAMVGLVAWGNEPGRR